MPSFDIVSRINPMEVENGVNQARKELSTRFDLRGSGAEIGHEGNEIRLRAPDAFKMRGLVEMVVGRLARRGIDPKGIDQGEPELSPLGHARQVLRIRQGIDGAQAREIGQFIRGLGLKVTAAIQGQEIRVTGKSRNDLQEVIGAIRRHDFPLVLDFVNFRD